MMDKKCGVPDSVLARHEARLEKESRRREAGEEDGGRGEAEGFESLVRAREAEVAAALAAAEALSGDRAGAAAALSAAGEALKELRHEAFARASQLRQWDLRRCKETIEALEERTRSAEERLLPRRKFGFKARPASNGTVLPTPDTVDTSIITAPTPLPIQHNYLFYKRKGETLRAEVAEGDAGLCELEDCTVVLSGMPVTVTLSEIRNCTVVLSPVRTSVVVAGAEGLKLAAACQQVRLHAAHTCDLYLHATTRPVLEDCTGVRLAPHPDPPLEAIAAVGLNPQVNSWQPAEDFNWLSKTKPSPNWTIIPENERLMQWPN